MSAVGNKLVSEVTLSGVVNTGTTQRKLNAIIMFLIMNYQYSTCSVWCCMGG